MSNAKRPLGTCDRRQQPHALKEKRHFAEQASQPQPEPSEHLVRAMADGEAVRAKSDSDLLELQREKIVSLREQLKTQRESFVRYLRASGKMTWREADETADKIVGRNRVVFS